MKLNKPIITTLALAGAVSLGSSLKSAMSNRVDKLNKDTQSTVESVLENTDSGIHTKKSDSVRINKDNNSLVNKSDKELAQEALNGNREAADLLIENVQEVIANDDGNNFEKKLKEIQLTEEEYRLISRARSLRQMVNEINSDDIGDFADIEWKNLGGEANKEKSLEEYIHKRMEKIEIKLEILSADEVTSETFLKLAEMSEQEFYDLVSSNVDYFRKLTNDPNRNYELLEKFSIKGE